MSKRKTQRWLKALLASIALASCLCAYARGAPRGATRTSFYVDDDNGNDAYDGLSPATAWKTLDKVNAKSFKPGDRILLKSGSQWTGQLWPKGSGAEGLPIVIDMYGGGVLPVINGDKEDAVLLRNQQYWEIQNLDLTNSGSAAGVRRGVHVDADNCGELHHIYLRRLTIHDVNGSDAVKPNGGINYTAEGDTKPSRFVDLRIEDNDIYHVDRSGIFGWSTHWVRSKWFPSLGLVLRNNRLHDIGGDGIVVVAADGALVEHNVVGHANQRSEGYNVAIWPWSSDNTIIQYNEALATHGQRDGEGFDADWNSRGTIIQYNYSHDNDGGFVLICNEGGHSPDESAGNQGTVVRYNLSVNDRTRGINMAGPVKGAQIYNNTIYVGKGHAVDMVLQSDWKGWADSTAFYNNIFYVEGEAQFTYSLSRNPDGAYVTQSGVGQSTNNVFDSNVYFDNIKPAEDRNALVSDPLMITPGSYDPDGYRLKQGSSAINSGKAVDSSGSKDFVGAPVPSCGGVERGAFEDTSCGARK